MQFLIHFGLFCTITTLATVYCFYKNFHINLPFFHDITTCKIIPEHKHYSLQQLTVFNSSEAFLHLEEEEIWRGNLIVHVPISLSLQELPTFPEKITLIFSIQPLVSPATPPFAEHQLKEILNNAWGSTKMVSLVCKNTDSKGFKSLLFSRTCSCLLKEIPLGILNALKIERQII